MERLRQASLPPLISTLSVTNGTTYYYVVSAVNEGGEGPVSSQVSATPQAPAVPATPTGLTATAGKKKASLSWTAVSGATSYRVKRSTTNGGPYTIVASNVTDHHVHQHRIEIRHHLLLRGVGDQRHW